MNVVEEQATKGTAEMRNKLFTIAIASLSLVGCATVTRGTKEVLVVESDPIGAKVSTSLGLTGITPATSKVSRKGGFVVTIEKEGYETVQVQVSNQVAGAGAAGMAGNILLGGLIGAAIDAGSGAMKELKPNPIIVKMVPLGAAKTDDAPIADTTAPDAPADVAPLEPSQEQPGQNTTATTEGPNKVSFAIIELTPSPDGDLLVNVYERG